MTMNASKLAKLRRQANYLFRKNPENSTMEFVINGQVYGTYTIPYDHFVEPDSKTPVEWVNGCVCFGIDYKGLDNPKVEIRMKG